MMKRTMSAAAAVFAAISAEAKTVVFADVTESEKRVSVFEAAVKEAGHEVRHVEGGVNILADDKTYDGADIVVLTGGWGSMLPNASVRRLVRFAAQGGGVFLGAFRSGPVRTYTQPPFPEVAATCNRVDSPWLWGFGDSPIAKAFGDSPVLFGGFDHLVLKVGEKGTVFAKCGDDPVGVFGEFGLGRVVVFGMFVSVPADDESAAVKQGIYKAIVEYLADGQTPAAAESAKAGDEAVAAFDHRLLVWEWIGEGHGPGRRPGIVPAMRDNTVVPVESKAMLLEFYARELKDNTLAAQCGELAKKVRAVSGEIRTLSENKIKEIASSSSRESSSLDFLKDKNAAETALKAEFAAIAAKSPDSEAVALIEKARIALRAQRKAERYAEHAEDIKSIPSLVARLSAPDSEVRLFAATELGRIGEATPEVVAALAKALDDADDKVRVQAAISLGWMPAKDAVPALIVKARQNGDWPLKRRALQALGQIGDDRAIPVLMDALDSIDRYTVENAMLSLGYLKAKEAVPKLIEIASDDSKPVRVAKRERKRVEKTYWNTRVMNRRGCAVAALGYIGDKSALPVLEDIEKKNEKSTNHYVANDDSPTRSGGGVSLNFLAKEAIAAIAQGGRAVKGVRQPEAWSSKDVFYGITRGNNALIGRIDTILGKMEAFKGDRENLFLPYILDSGMTGIHGAWGDDFCSSEKGAEKVIREMDDYGLKFVGTAPSGGFATILDIHRPAQDRAFDRFGDLTSYAGLWSEEDWGTDFQGFKLPENPDPSVCELGASARAARVARVEAAGAEQEDRWREIQDWLHARRKGFAMTFSVTQGNFYDEAMGTPAIASRFDNCGPERYESFGRNNAYLIERFRNGETRSVITEYYNWYASSMQHVLRGCWQNAMRSKCYYPFSLNQFSPFADWYSAWTSDMGRWDHYATVYRHVREHKDLYAVAPAATEIAVMLSERSAVGFRHTAVNEQSAVPEATDEAGLAIWTALSQSHLQADVVFIDDATEKKLSKYKVLFLTTAKMLTEREQELLRKWVSDGGTLVCEGTVSLFEPKNLMCRANYAISDLLGVNYVKTEFMPTKEVYAQRNGSLNGKVLFPVYQGLDNFFRFSEFVWRDVKPTDCIAVANSREFGTVEYDGSLGIDRVELTTAKAVQTFEEGAPALTENAYGKGRVYLFTAMCPSYGHVTSRWEMNPNKFDFWPGVRETYEKLAREGLARAGTEPAVDLLGAPKDLDVVAYSQNGGDRLVVHMLDYDTSRMEIPSVTLRINGNRRIKAAYRPGAKPLAPAGRTVRLGKLSVYDMVVVDFE